MACSAQSAQIGGYFSLSTTGPSKGVLFFNFFIVSHVATICTFDPMQVELLELFFCSSDCWHELCPIEDPSLKIQIEDPFLFSKK